MKRLLVPFATALLVTLAPLGAADAARAQEPAAPAAEATAEAPAAAPASASVERGRYLVEKVAMCGQCHSPRDARGELRMEAWLHGAPVPLTTPEGYADKWAYKAPRIAGLPQYENDELFVTLMTTGMNRDGKEAMPPMPPFRMTAEDAQAIADYLRSLP